MSIRGAPQSAPVNRAWLIAGLLVTAASMAATGLTACTQIAGSGPVLSEHQGHTYHHMVSRVEIVLDSGNITLSPGQAGQVVVDRRLRWKHVKPVVTEVWDGGTLRVSSVCPNQDNCSVDYTLRVPASVTVSAHTAAGDVTAHEVTGAMDLRSESGDIKVTNPGAQVRIQGDSGNITGTGLRSTDVEVHTSSGDITLGFTVPPSTVTAVTQAGTVRIAVPRAGSGSDGYQVHASTTSGQRQVRIRQDSAGQRSITASTESGDVIISYA